MLLGKPTKPNTELAEFGVGVHHAGLSMDDRRLTEGGLLSGHLFAVVATSTLAVGVNLPCHTVIIKGTEMWDGMQSREYTDLDVIQMMGRAVCTMPPTCNSS